MMDIGLPIDAGQYRSEHQSVTLESLNITTIIIAGH